MAHDEKLRRPVIKYKDSGHTFAQVNEAFGVGSRSYYNRKAELEENGKFENHYPKSRPGNIDPESNRSPGKRKKGVLDYVENIVYT
jgi:transposase